jgi:RecA-family ATPase
MRIMAVRRMAATSGPDAVELAPDPAQILRQLGFWFEGCLAGEIDLGWRDPGTGQLNRFRRFDLGDLDACAAFAAETNAVAGQSMYFRPALVKPDAPRHVRDGHFLAAPGPWADLDAEGAAERAPALYAQCRPNMVVVTGRYPHTRVQFYWRREDLVHDGAVLRDWSRRVAMRLGGDTKVINPTSLMRLGGTIAWPWKPGRVPERTELHLFDDARSRSYPVGAIEHAFPPILIEGGIAFAAPANARPTPLESSGFAPAALNIGSGTVPVDACMAAIRRGDHWHNNMVRLTGHWIARGWSDAEILAAAASLTLKGYAVEDTYRDVTRMIGGGRRKWDTPNPGHAIEDGEAEPRPPVIDPRSWAGRPIPERQWLVGDWIPLHYVTALYGDGGLGKTLLAHQLLTSVATGHDWLGLPVRRMRAFGLLCEDLESDLHINQERINRAYWLSYDQLGDLRLWPSVGLDNLLMTFDGRDGAVGQLTRFFAELLERVKSFGAQFVVLDTAADLFGGNENNRIQVRQFIANACGRIAREIDGAVLLCAHPSLSGLASGTGAGGSTAWNNTVRSRLYLAAPRAGDLDDEPDPDLRVLSRKKSNHARAGEMLNLRWVDGVFVRQAEESLSETERIALWRAVLDEIARAWNDGTPYSDAPQAKNRYILAHLPRKLDRSRSEVEQAYVALLDRGCFRVEFCDRHANLRGLQVVKWPPEIGGGNP